MAWKVHIELTNDEAFVNRVEEEFADEQKALDCFHDLSADLESIGREHGSSSVTIEV